MPVKTAPEISLRYAQGQVFNCDKRFRVLVAGRRFGKSYLSCIELIRGAINRPGETYFYCAPTYRMAKDIAWKELKRLVPKIWIKSKNETDLRIELINGSTIELKGTENAITRILKAKYEDQDISLSLYPEWMIRTNRIGNTDSTESIQITLRDNEVVANPQSIELLESSNSSKSYIRSVGIPKEDFYNKPVEYTAGTTFSRYDYTKS